MFLLSSDVRDTKLKTITGMLVISVPVVLWDLDVPGAVVTITATMIASITLVSVHLIHNDSM